MDANISRWHAAVVLHKGQFSIQDFGHAGRIEHNGAYIEGNPTGDPNVFAGKLIEHGDVFYICDYELKFFYQ